MLYAYAPHLDGLAPLPAGEALAHARWIDLVAPEGMQVRQVEQLGITVPTLADMEEIEISNRLYREGETDIMTAVLPGQTPDGRAVAMPVTFILSPDRLVTVRHHAPRPFETFPARAARSSAGVASADHIFLGLIEEIISRLADLLEGAGAAIDSAAAQVFDSADQPRDPVLHAALQTMGQQAESMARVRLALLTIERVLSFHSANVDATAHAAHLRGIAAGLDRDVQALEVHADFLGTRVQMTVDATLGLINLQQNNTVRMLSVVAALFLPPMLIASIYGMNFDRMPELHWPVGYAAALGLMLGSAVLTYLFLKWRHWL